MLALKVMTHKNLANNAAPVGQNEFMLLVIPTATTKQCCLVMIRPRAHVTVRAFSVYL